MLLLYCDLLLLLLLLCDLLLLLLWLNHALLLLLLWLSHGLLLLLVLERWIVATVRAPGSRPGLLGGLIYPGRRATPPHRWLVPVLHHFLPRLLQPFHPASQHHQVGRCQK